MIAKNRKTFKKLGILMMSSIMLSSIAPLNSMSADASKRNHPSYKQTIIYKSRKNNNTHKNNLRKLRASKSKLSSIKNRVKRSKGKKKAKAKKQYIIAQHSYNVAVRRANHSAWLANEYQKALDRLQKQVNQDAKTIQNDSKSLNEITANKNAMQQKLQKMHVQYYNQIKNLMDQQANAQKQTQKMEQTTYKPANVPKEVNFSNTATRLNNNIYSMSNKQTKPANKAYIKQVAKKENKKNTQLKNTMKGQEKDHKDANTKYIQKLNYENKIIDYGLNPQNGVVYNDVVNNLRNQQDFSSATPAGRKIQKDAKSQEKQIERTIGKKVKKHDNNVNDKYMDRMLDSEASNNNSAAQYYANHLNIHQVLKNTKNPKQRKQLEKEYNNVKKHKKMYNKAKHEYNVNHHKYRNKYKYHINKKGMHKYSKIMSKYERLRATKQTRAVRAQEKALYKQAQQARKQQINSINSQIKQLSEEITQQQQVYNKLHERWQDVNGNIPLREQYHNKMDQVQDNINDLKKQINSLEDQAVGVYNNMQQAKSNDKEAQYYHMINGNVKSVKNISHPKYVRISAPTYYLDGYDVSNKHIRDMKVQPNTPKSNPNHYVNSAYKVTLSDNTSYLLYNINSNDSNDQDSYFILARYTTPVTVKPFKPNPYYKAMPKHFEAVATHGGTWYSIHSHNKNIIQFLNSGHPAGHYRQGTTFHVIGEYAQKSKNSKPVFVYKVQTERDGVFNNNTKSKNYGSYYTKYGHKIMYVLPQTLHLEGTWKY